MQHFFYFVESERSESPLLVPAQDIRDLGLGASLRGSCSFSSSSFLFFFRSVTAILILILIL
jgi:hypothetical protein